MAKDPAVLWYWGDWYGGTITFSRHLKGCYMDLLYAQFNGGPLSLEAIKTILGADFGSAWPTLQKKFKEANGCFFNEKMEAEKEKRRAHSNKQRENVGKRWRKEYGGNTNVYTKSMPLESESESESGIGVKDGGAGETIRGEVSYSAVETVEKNAIKFEHLCMKYSKTAEQGKELLTDYHLWMQKNEKYPKTKQALFAGFESWIRNDKKINSNGTKTNKQSSASGNEKPGTSEARVNTAGGW